MSLTYLNPKDPGQPFPELEKSLQNPNGLLAIGGCLSQERLLNAYRQGIFPWYGPGEPILWWSPSPRTVIFPERLHISKSLRKTLNKGHYTFTYDKAFNAVIEACAKPRLGESGTWISKDIKRAYRLLHTEGVAHSAEVWFGDELVGGLYGIAIGQVFFGESMFYSRTDASKVAFVQLVRRLIDWGYQLIDCQVYNPHLATLGAEEIPRTRFKTLLDQYVDGAISSTAWQQP